VQLSLTRKALRSAKVLIFGANYIRTSSASTMKLRGVSFIQLALSVFASGSGDDVIYIDWSLHRKVP